MKLACFNAVAQVNLEASTRDNAAMRRPCERRVGPVRSSRARPYHGDADTLRDRATSAAPPPSTISVSVVRACAGARPSHPVQTPGPTAPDVARREQSSTSLSRSSSAPRRRSPDRARNRRGPGLRDGGTSEVDARRAGHGSPPRRPEPPSLGPLPLRAIRRAGDRVVPPLRPLGDVWRNKADVERPPMLDRVDDAVRTAGWIGVEPARFQIRTGARSSATQGAVTV